MKRFKFRGTGNREQGVRVSGYQDFRASGTQQLGDSATQRLGDSETQRLIPNCLVVLLTCCLLLSSCGIYSFSGASIPAEAKTVSVQYFPNNAPLVNPLLSNTITNALNDMFVNQTTLQSVAQNGDLALEGEITGYSTSPIAITGNQTAAMNRLTITVNVRFTNRYDESKNFEQSFSQYQDYPSGQDLSSVQDVLVEEIVNDLCEDIFNKAVVNW